MESTNLSSWESKQIYVLTEPTDWSVENPWLLCLLSYFSIVYIPSTIIQPSSDKLFF